MWFRNELSSLAEVSLYRLTKLSPSFWITLYLLYFFFFLVSGSYSNHGRKPSLLHHLRLGQLPPPAVLALPLPILPTLVYGRKTAMSYSEVSLFGSHKISRKELWDLTDSEEVLLAHEQHCTIVANLYNHARRSCKTRGKWHINPLNTELNPICQ